MLTILVIDDDRTILNMVKLTLTKFGYNVETASDGKEGIQKFDNGLFDLVITDVRMPVMDGKRVVKHIRNSARPFTPVIGISGTPWLLEDSDFDLVISKPFQLKVLLDSVVNLTAASPDAVTSKPR